MVGTECAVVDVPEHGYLDRSGERWLCDRGYRPADNGCVPVGIPVNAYLSDLSYGPGWQCERGYREADGACSRIAVPGNAHLDYTGNDWECNEPYRESGPTCVIVE
jgi:hypothetical protein